MRAPGRWVLRGLGALAALVIVVFAIANRFVVNVSLAPLPWMVEQPLWVVILLFFALGALLGGIVVWVQGHPVRRLASRRGRRIRELERKLGGSRGRLAAPGSGARGQSAVLPDRDGAGERDAA